MSNIFLLSAKIKNLKCIGEKEQGFDSIKPMNLIIGRNNSGKSTLLDLIWALTVKVEFPEAQWHRGQRPQIILEAPLDEVELRIVFPENTSGGTIGSNHWHYGRNFIGSHLTWCYNCQESQRFVQIKSPPSLKPAIEELPDGRTYLTKLANVKRNPFEGRVFKRIYAERDIAPETDAPQDLQVQGNGKGTTNIIQNFINKVGLPSELVEAKLLTELNSIFGPDACFTDIVCQQSPSSLWEIYLEEKTKGRIPLSQSGSGLKTIILVLVFFYLVPAVEKRELQDYVFGFEELENNLHPALLRRLLAYIYNKYKEVGCLFFITTHSNVTIDQFSKNSGAQIIHVTHDRNSAKARTIRTYVENKGILDDLDVRASDLLQSNGVVWVEGPSDRIYFNRWIELWSDGSLREGTHYQCVFYGGRLLSHLAAGDPRSVGEAVSMLNINRNALIIIDSDKRASRTRLNDTKRRIIEEAEKHHGIVWVTMGRTIENYIPARTVAQLFALKSCRQVEQYEDFFVYLDGVKAGEGRRYVGRKPILAEKICPLLEKNDIQNMLDLGRRLEQACQAIKKWNAIDNV